MDLVESAEPTRTVVQALEDDGVVWDPVGYGVALGTSYILRSAYAWPTAKYAEQNSWWPTPHNDLPLSSLPAQVRVSQTYCEDMPNEMVGPASDWRAVKEAPVPMPPLKEPSIQFEGLDYYEVRGAYVGRCETLYYGAPTFSVDRRHDFEEAWGYRCVSLYNVVATDQGCRACS